MSNIDNNDDDGYTGPEWYRPGKNRDLFLGLLVIFLLVGLGGVLSRCDAGRDFAERFGFDSDGGEELVEDLDTDDDGGDDDDDLEPPREVEVPQTTIATPVESPDVRGALDSANFGDIGERVNGSVAVLTGTVASQALKDEAEAEALGVSGIDEVDNQIVVRDLAQEIRDAHAADGIEGVGVAVDEDGVAVLTGTVPDEATRARAEELARGIDGVTDVDNQLVIEEEAAPPPPPPPADPFAVTGAVSDGVLTLTGAVPSEEVRTAMVEAASAELGAESVIDELTIDDALGEEGTLTLTGEADAEAADAIVQAAGSAADEAGADVDNQLVVSTPPPPQDLPDSLNEILRAQPILFAVASAEILPESQPIIDEVAQILNDNPDGSLLVEGHTDSDGDDGLNLQLSQARADSVRTALIAQNVAADRLTAIGRGESELILVDGEEDKDASRRIEFKLP